MYVIVSLYFVYVCISSTDCITKIMFNSFLHLAGDPFYLSGSSRHKLMSIAVQTFRPISNGNSLAREAHNLV